MSKRLHVATGSPAQARAAGAVPAALPIGSFADAVAAVNARIAEGGNATARASPSDVVDLLPASAGEKLRAFKREANDLHVLNTSAIDELWRLRADRAQIEARVKRLVAHPQDGGFGRPDDDPQVIAERKRLDKATAEVARLNAINEARSAHWQNMRSLIDALERWVAAARGPLVAHESSPPKLRKGETGLEAIRRLRHEIAQLGADLKATRAAPIPAAAAKQLVAEQLAELARQGRPDLYGVIEHRDQVTWPRVNVSVEHFDSAPVKTVAVALVPNALAVVAWAFGAELLEKLEAEIDLRADDQHALSDEDRASRLASLSAEMLGLERDEEHLIATESGQAIQRRADASPPAVLGVSAGGE